MTERQREAVELLLAEFAPTEVAHGDCCGADFQFSVCARRAGCRIVSHPCTLKSWRANSEADETREPLPPLVRNRNIVDETDGLIAAPAEMTERLRGGTWATARYARKQGKLLAIVWPDGSISR